MLLWIDDKLTLTGGSRKDDVKVKFHEFILFHINEDVCVFVDRWLKKI